jgi:hypothetical protein
MPMDIMQMNDIGPNFFKLTDHFFRYLLRIEAVISENPGLQSLQFDVFFFGKADPQFIPVGLVAVKNIVFDLIAR